MERKSVRLVDAFANEPLAGVPVPVVPAASSRTQLRAVVNEFGASGAVTLEDDSLVYVEADGSRAFVEAAVAGWTGLYEDDLVDAGTETLTVVTRDGEEQEYSVESEADRAVRVTLPEQECAEAESPLDRVAPALGVDTAAIESVSGELPLGRTDAFGGTLFVPIGFLEELSAATPDRETLATILTETGTTRVCAFTFDTLARRSDLHVRVFDPSTTACERATSGVAVAGCGQYLAQYEAFDGDIDTARVESGHFSDRPCTVETTLDSTPSVGGRALSVLDSSIAVPEDSDDEIIEV